MPKQDPTQPRELTADEVRRRLLDHVWHLVRYWAEDARTPDTSGKLEGLAFSILSALDGCAGSLPGFVVAPSPHPDDKAYHQGRGENWYPACPDVPCDIAGALHELFYGKGTPAAAPGGDAIPPTGGLE